MAKQETWIKVYVTVEHYSINAIESLDAMFFTNKKGEVTAVYTPGLKKAARKAAISVAKTLRSLEQEDDVDSGMEMLQTSVATNSQPSVLQSNAVSADLSDVFETTIVEMGENSTITEEDLHPAASWNDTSD